MASSAFAAVVDRIQSLPGLPKLYTFDAPPSDAGAQVYVPYMVLEDHGTGIEYDFQKTAMEVTELVLHVYGNLLSDVDTIVERVKYNGWGISAGQGLDFGALPTLTIDYGNLEVRRMREQRFAALATGKDAQRIHQCDLSYRVTLYRYAASS